MGNDLVKCCYCGKFISKKFDDGTYTKIQVGKSVRYAHDACIRKNTTEVEDRNRIHEKVKEVCGTDYSSKRVDRQIDELLENDRTLTGILKTLEYWYDVKHSDPRMANGGIGIVDYVYGEAKEYYKKQMQQRNRNRDVPQSKYDEMDSFLSSDREFKMNIGGVSRKRHRFTLE